MRNERRTSGSGTGAAETCAGNRASAPRPHFHWRRWKTFWRGGYTEGHDPGLSYERAACEAAVIVTPWQHAVEMEARLIRRLRPRDNLIGQADEAEAIPF